VDNYRLVDLQGYSFIIGLILVISVFAKKKESSYSSLLYILLCSGNMVLLALDGMGGLLDVLDEGRSRVLPAIGGTLYYALHPLPIVVWLNYVEYNLTGSFGALKRKAFYFYPLLISVGLVSVSLFYQNFSLTGTLSVYHQRLWVRVFTLLDWLGASYSLILAYAYRHRVEYRLSGFIVSLTMIPLLGSLVEITRPGESLEQPFITLMLIGAYFFLEMRKETRDPLTGFMNRQQLDQWVEYRINHFKRMGPFCYIIVDINQFKAINDGYGHALGDLALRTLSDILFRSIKKSDKLARFGGDEFVILLETDDEDDVHQALWRFQKELDERNLSRSEPFILSYSYGYALYRPDEVRDSGELFAKAERMMFKAKKRRKKPFGEYGVHEG